MKKKILAVLLACTLAVGMAVSPVGIQTVRAEETTEDGFTYSINSWSGGNPSGIGIDKYTGDATALDIPGEIDGIPVKEIGENAFAGCNKLVSVTIPDSVRNIRNEAFKDCTSLTSITISASVENGIHIGHRVFEGCTSLKNLMIPASVDHIGAGILNGCSNTQVVIDENNPYLVIEDNIVYNKEKTKLFSCLNADIVTNVTIPDSVTEINEEAFKGCTSLKSITIPNGVRWIYYQTFEGCTSLTSITIPNSITSIGDEVFKGCASLTNITIPNGVTRIDEQVFEGCTSLASLTIPASVTYIGAGILNGCSNTIQVVIDKDNPNLMIEDNIVYNKEKTKIYSYLDANVLTNVTIPDGVTSIINRAFCHATNLTNITIPDSVTIIGQAFIGCTNLTNIIIPPGVTRIEDNTLSGCTSLTSINVPEGVTFIGEVAFGTSGLVKIGLPSSLTSIGYNALARNPLKDIYYAGSKEQWERMKLSHSDKTITKEALGIDDSVTIHYNSTMPTEPETTDKPDEDQNKDQTETIKKSDQTITAKNITKTYGAKAFSLNAKVNTKTALTYASSDRKVATIDKKGKVTIKGCGITNITITAPAIDKYKQTKKTIKLTVKPKKVALSSVKSTKKKTATVKWKQDKKASGYIIQFATDSKFKKNKVQTTVSKNKTVSSTVKKLKAGKKYYVRICAYAKSGKTKVQGDWSKAKTVKVKK